MRPRKFTVSYVCARWCTQRIGHAQKWLAYITTSGLSCCHVVYSGCCNCYSTHWCSRHDAQRIFSMGVPTLRKNWMPVVEVYTWLTETCMLLCIIKLCHNSTDYDEHPFHSDCRLTVVMSWHVSLGPGSNSDKLQHTQNNWARAGIALKSCG